MKKCLFAAAICMCMFVAAFITGCGKKENAAPAAEEQVTQAALEPEKTPDITYKELYEANRGSRLIEKYGSVQYELYLSEGAYDGKGNEIGSSETWTLLQQDGKYVLMRETGGRESIVYADGTCYYERNVSEKKRLRSMGWFMNDSYEKYMNSGVEEFLLTAESGEDFDSVEEEEDAYVLLAYAGDSDGEKYYYRYTVDRESFEIRNFEALVREEKGDEWVLSRGTVVHGAPAELPAFVNEMRQAEKKRTVVIHTEEKKEKKDIEVKLPENATLLVMLEEDYGLFQDKKGKKVFDDTQTAADEAGVYPDAECYLVSVGAK